MKNENSTRFDIESSGSKTKKPMTIKEAISESVLRSEKAQGYSYHATDYKEIGEKIIKEGFDPMKISRTKFGPGFYFSPSEGGALFYSSCVLKSDFDGNCAIVDGPFYERILDSDVHKKLADFIGLKSNEYSLMIQEEKIINKLVNEYARNVIVNELGYDMAYGSSRAESCFAVFNPNILSNIRFK